MIEMIVSVTVNPEATRAFGTLRQGKLYDAEYLIRDGGYSMKEIQQITRIPLRALRTLSKRISNEGV